MYVVIYIGVQYVQTLVTVSNKVTKMIDCENFWKSIDPARKIII